MPMGMAATFSRMTTQTPHKIFMMRTRRPRLGRRQSVSESPIASRHRPRCWSLYKALEQQHGSLVGRYILYNWPDVGWCVGQVREANRDSRRTMTYKKDGENEKRVVNFLVYYEIDDNLSKHVLTLAEYGGLEPDGWVLLEPVEAEEDRLEVEGGSV